MEVEPPALENFAFFLHKYLNFRAILIENNAFKTWHRNWQPNMIQLVALMGTRWTDYIEDLGWNRLGLRPSEMMEVMEDREVWRLNLELLPPQPSRKSGQ